MTITIPELSLVVLIGPSGAGKSSFARKHFKETEILSSDRCRGLVSDDENNQAATNDAFEVLRFVATKRLAAGRLTVIDATNVQPEGRKPLVGLAREFHCLPVAIVLDLPEKVCQERNRARPDRDFGNHVTRQQSQALRRSLRGLEREGFRHIHVLRTPDEIDGVVVERQPLWCNMKGERGPFDIVGDVHGCLDELRALLGKLGYEVAPANTAVGGLTAKHPEGRKLVFLGDLVDRGPEIPGVLRLVMNMVEAGTAFAVPGNHDVKLLRKLRGKDVKLTHGLAETVAQLEPEPDDFKRGVASFIDDLVSHLVLDGGRLVVAHAGMKETMQGRGSGKVREFALYGETTGETDEYGLPVRYDWASEYRGRPSVVYGHTPVPEAEWLNNTICIDTGCVFGGKLTVLRWPERELVDVPAARTYFEPAKPLARPEAAALTSQQINDTPLDFADVSGKRLITTRLFRNITIREENSAAALEAMSRFATDPLGLPRLRADAVVAESAGAAARPVCVGGRGGAHRIAADDRCARGRRRWRRRRLGPARAGARPSLPHDPIHRRVPPLLLAGRRR
jgi:polynucleotide kinase-phosphatase